jgi:hypothetical protein
MNTGGVQNPDCNEKRKWYAVGLLVVLRYVKPPHRNNEAAAKHLHRKIGRNNNNIEWRSVRLGPLINAPIPPYETNESLIMGIFTGRPTSWASVAQFMTKLIVDADIWRK